MELERMADEGKDEFLFYSEGLRGRIKKMVRFRQIKGLGNNTYNLAFGDWDEAAGRLDDKSVSNNNDSLKVLSTVAQTVIEFMKSRPNAIILVKGSTLPRVRLYQIAVSAYWPVISQQYQIYGKVAGKWLPFEKGVNYQEFLIFKKNK